MLWVGQFGIVDGEVSEDSPWVGAFPAGSRVEPEEAADLFVLVEPAGEGSEAYCRDLAQAIGKQFGERQQSLTGSMLRALKAAHESLRDWNRRSLKEHRAGAGISCLGLRGREAYLAQVAPATAVLFQDGSLRRLTPRLPDAAEPLGLHDIFWPDFSRYDLEEGDRLLLLSPPLAGHLSDEDVSAALQAPPSEALPALYRLAKGMPRGAVVLVAALAEEDAP